MKFFYVHIFTPEYEIETLRHVIQPEINIEEISAFFVFRYEVSHVSAAIYKNVGQKSCLDCTVSLKNF